MMRVFVRLACAGLIGMSLLAASVQADPPTWIRHATPLPQAIWAAEAIDVNSDGLPDQVAVGQDAVWAMLAPTWQRVELARTPGGRTIHAVRLDCDGDGDEDLALGRSASEWIQHRELQAAGKPSEEPQGQDWTVAWIENPGRDAFPWKLHRLDRELHGVHGLWTGDVDRDGALDLIADSFAGPHLESSLAWFPAAATENGQPMERRMITEGGATGRPHYMDFGDIDGDGRGDVLLGASTEGSFTWWRQPKDLDSPWDRNVIAWEPGASHPRVADLSGDGRPDVLGSTGHGQGVFWFEAPNWKRHIIDPDIRDVHAFDAADLDGDGDIDCAGCSFSERRVCWWENRGGGDFRRWVIDEGNAQEAYDLKIRDLNRDGRADILLAGRRSNNLVWYENAAPQANREAPSRPNLLLVLTDDQGWPTLGSYGGKIVPTPHLDRLAAEGVRLTDAYVTSQCTPTRATLLTGQYTARHGLWHVLSWYGYPWARMVEPAFAENYSRDTFTLAKGLRQAGYATGIMGKWHLTSNADGNYMGLFPQAAPHYGFDFAPPVLTNKQFEPGDDRGVDELTDQAIRFIRQNRSQPWFCFLSHHMIHGKVVAPQSLVEKYRQRGYGDEGPYRAVYLAGLEHIDHSIGRLMTALDEANETDETMVVFLSDNGGIDLRYRFQDLKRPHAERPAFPADLNEYDNEPLRAGKGSVYEGGVRVPMIVRWPAAIPAGQVIETPVHAVDILPTMLDVAGATSPEDHELDGRSLRKLLVHGAGPTLARRSLFQYYPFYDLRWGLTPSASIRQGDYKLIEFFGDRVDAEGRYVPGREIELYDLRQDLGEEDNLAESRPELAASLLAELHDWIGAVGAEIPAANPNHDPSRAFEETRDKPPWIAGR